MNLLKLTVDENIVFAKEAFADFGRINLLNGRKISRKDLTDTDILIVRSITQVDSALLDGTKVKVVGTATIGTDHIDIQYLKSKGITFFSAEGCNSMSVAEYVLAVLIYIASEFEFTLENKSIGIIGVGNVGSKVRKIAESLGMKVIQNDPPKQRAYLDEKYYNLEEALSADIVTFHVPLNMSGIDKTYHLLNKKNISLIKPMSILINTSRGAVIDNLALKNRLKKRRDFRVVLDVWEKEPDIDIELLNLIDIATPHIAGYSLDGKVNGTKIIYDSICSYLKKEISWKPELSCKNEILKWDSEKSLEQNLYNIFQKVYPVWEDDQNFRKSIESNYAEVKNQFDLFRKNYWTRHELSNYEIDGNNLDLKTIKLLQALKINIC